MSLIRLSRPGYPTTLIDQGPQAANMSGYGGSRIEPRVPKTTAEYNREARAKLRGEALLEKPRSKRFVDMNTGTNLDNGVVQAPITEVQP